MSYDIQSIPIYGMADLVERCLKTRIAGRQGLDSSRTTIVAVLLPAFFFLRVLNSDIHLEDCI
jgi:hypothetical protein